MKRFDSLAILERYVSHLKGQGNWNNLQEDGATYQFLETLAEGQAEIARYGEYLLQELKWDTSRNYSSTKHMARLVGKKLDRVHSTVGTVIVSHSDITGSPRYSFLGTYNFNIDAQSDYDDLEKDKSLKEDTYIHALTPWLDINTYTVPKGAKISTRTGINFIVAQQRTIGTWQQRWSEVNRSLDSFKNFKAAGGWNNFKYITVPVVQGIQKQVTLGISTGAAGQSFLVSTLDIEAADTYYTKDFCYVTIQQPGSDTGDRWSEVYHLQTTQSTDRVFEINILDDLSGTEIKFGDGVFGAIPSKDAVITLHYIESLGTKGIVSDLYSFQNGIDGIMLPKETIYRGLTVGCQNVWPLIGGRDLETLSEFKTNAETAYMKNYKILHTFTELENQINTISPVPLLKVKLSTDYEIRKVNSTNVYRNVIGLSGLSMGLKPLNSTEQTVFESTVNQVINDNILANKPIIYRTPNILSIDSNIDIELTRPVLDKDKVKTELQDYLQSRLGRTNLDTLMHYTRVQVVQQALECNNNIGAIQATNLFTVDTTATSYGIIDSTRKPYILFEFDFPKVETDVLGRSGYFEKDLADGNEVYCIFNLSIMGNKTTILVRETASDKLPKVFFEKSSPYFSDNLPVTLYSDQLNSKYNLYQTIKEKHCFSMEELQDISRLKYTGINNFQRVCFYTDRSSNKPKLYLLLDARSVANQLGFAKQLDFDISKVYTQLQSSLDSGFTRVTVSLEPSDQTVFSDWNTIMYYDYINVNIL